VSVLSDSLTQDTVVSEVTEPEPELQLASGGEPPVPPETIWGESNLPAALISDIDHTISFPAPTREFMDFSKSLDDIPNNKVIALIKEWYSSTEKPTIYFVTNRAVGWRDVTVRWLVQFFPPAQYRWVLRMRPANDFVSLPWQVKEDHLVKDIAKKHSIKQVWEDDDECIAMYRHYRLTVFDAKDTW
jgi:hypothetical protein